jgi:hypothetical protein
MITHKKLVCNQLSSFIGSLAAFFYIEYDYSPLLKISLVCLPETQSVRRDKRREGVKQQSSKIK